MSSHRTKGGEWVGLLPAGCVSAPQPHRGLTRPRPQPRIPPPLRPAVGSPRPGPQPAPRTQPPSLPAPTRRPDAAPGGPAKPPPGRGRAPPPLCLRSVPLRPPPRPAPARGPAPRPTARGDGGPASVATATALRSSVAGHRWHWGAGHPKGPRAGPGSLPVTVAHPQPENRPAGRFSPASALKFRCSPHPARPPEYAPHPRRAACGTLNLPAELTPTWRPS